MKVCTLLQTDNHISTPPLNFCRPDVLPAAQPTASKHWRPLLSWYHHWNKQLNYTGYRADWTALSWTAGWSLEAFCTIVSSDCVGSFSFSSESVLSVCGTLRRFSRCSSRLFCTNNQQVSTVQVASGHKTAVLLFLLQQVSVCPTMTPKSVPSFGEILPPPNKWFLQLYKESAAQMASVRFRVMSNRHTQRQATEHQWQWVVSCYALQCNLIMTRLLWAHF